MGVRFIATIIGKHLTMRTSTWILQGIAVGAVVQLIVHIGVLTEFRASRWVWYSLIVLSGLFCRQMLWQTRIDAVRILVTSIGSIIFILFGLSLVSIADPYPAPLPWYTAYGLILWVFAKTLWGPFWLGATFADFALRRGKPMEQTE